MASQAPSDDIRVKVSARAATVALDGEDYKLTFTNGSTFIISRDNIASNVLCKHAAGMAFKEPQHIMPGCKQKLPSIVVRVHTSSCNDGFDNLMLAGGAEDARALSHVITACGDHTVYVLPDQKVVVLGKKTCRVVQSVSFAVLQRTQGGMSTYDVHLLHEDSDSITTIEMLPHSSLGMWQQKLGSDHVIDAGPDPVPISFLQSCHNSKQWVISGEDFTTRKRPYSGSSGTSSSSSDDDSEYDVDAGTSSSSSESEYSVGNSSAEDDDLSDCGEQ